ncbi:FxLD family lanthipeptide [Kribbella catacumbae]|uniref:FxLD family lanthipeptide n=1 Tax=Kribbella catacumbae TaxID=460086 RepID=UPI000377A5AB|nr:FxLD family lanthipeptide [Kribbella catacumbae]
MRTTTEVISTGPEQAFDLDIRALDIADAGPFMARNTDDNCGSTCPNACATNMG